MELDAEDEDAFRLALFEELETQNAPFDMDEFSKTMDKEFAIFKGVEKYSFVKDITEAYKDSLAETTEQKIFKTIPAHVFWDIKKPQTPE